MKFLLDIFKGIAIGAGAILPGISSGVLCVIFGIYEKLVNSVLDLFHDFKKNVTFLLPIIIGVAIGFFLFGNLLNYVYLHYESECKLLFLGFILGNIPALFKEANGKKKFRLSFLFYTLVSFGIGFILFLLENKMHFDIPTSNTNFLFLWFCGFAMSCGIIIPGVSSTVILLCFGSYTIYLQSISTLYLPVLIPIGLGVLCGCIFFLILIRFLLNHYSAQTYYAIIGFVLGSVFVLLPSSFSLFSLLLFTLGFYTALKLEK